MQILQKDLKGRWLSKTDAHHWYSVLQHSLFILPGKLSVSIFCQNKIFFEKKGEQSTDRLRMISLISKVVKESNSLSDVAM